MEAKIKLFNDNFQNYLADTIGQSGRQARKMEKQRKAKERVYQMVEAVIRK